MDWKVRLSNFHSEIGVRVNCTGLRCGIATYACNEGGFDTGFFARHFMKNREETTCLHYNLLSYRRHALNIAIKLYQDFSDNSSGVKISVQESDVASITSAVKNAVTVLPDTNKVLTWIKSNSPDLTKKEINDIVMILKELNVTSKIPTNSKTFYGQVGYGM